MLILLKITTNHKNTGKVHW